MDDYCRLCLKLCNEGMCDPLEDLDLSTKIRTCLLVEVATPFFFRKVCTPCTETVQELHNYYIKVAKNQILIQTYLEKDKKELVNFLNRYNDCMNTAKEHNYFEFNEEKPLEHTISSKTIDEIESIETDCKIKVEDIVKTEYNDLSHDSDDDPISLSQIKKEVIENKLNKNTVHNRKPVKIKKNRKQAKTIDDIGQNKTDDGLHKCLICSDFMGSKPEIIVHYKTVHGAPDSAQNVTDDHLHKCLICSDFIGSKPEILLHYKTVHSASEPQFKTDRSIEEYAVVKSDADEISYKCCKCDKVTVTRRQMMNHIECHDEDRPFVCRICGRTFKKPYEIFLHGRAHGEGPKLSCRFNCGYSTAYSGALKDHEKRHQSQYKYTCGECGKGFQVRTLFEQHRNVHTGARPFRCQYCPMAFQLNKNLSSHQSAVHPQGSNRRRHVCLHCQQPCDNRPALHRHMTEKHGVEYKKKRRKCLCDMCGKVMANSVKLMLHKRMHLNIRPYCCDHCSKSFSKKYNLIMHLRTHSGERKHSCAYCHKRYTQSSTLRSHRCRPLALQSDQTAKTERQAQET